MRITSFKIRNYRTLEHVDLDFPTAYTAICGPNDSGKTNVIRAIKSLIKEERPLPFIVFSESQDLSFKDDFPKWKSGDSSTREIHFGINLSIHQDRDAGFFQFLSKQLSLVFKTEEASISLDATYRSDRTEPSVKVQAEGKTFDGIDAQQVLKQLQSSKMVLIHNSTQIEQGFPVRSNVGGYFKAMTPEQESVVSSMKKTVSRGLGKLSKAHKEELETLLGRLQTKYSVGLSMPSFDFSDVPYRLTLGQKQFAVPLDDWGSGTKNRTFILLTLFRAKQVSDAPASASKVTPIIFIEEPESFLHPSAQAEFGRILQDMAEEFQVQVVVTTHSPYLLSITRPTSNILLSRQTHYNQLKETKRVNTSGDNWTKPFSLALGLDSTEFRPWKQLITTPTDSILLVEGDIDKEYFEMLKDPAHGKDQLTFEGDIVPYDGTGALQNTVLLRFIKNRHSRIFVTYDLDSEAQIEKTLQALALVKKQHYMPVGVNSAGKKNIEGLLPDSVTTAVYAANPALVQAATNGTKEEQKSAKGKLKKFLFEEFKRKAKPGAEFFGGFYQLTKVINKSMAT